MRLQYNCSSCKKSNNFSPKFPTRGAMQMQLGNEVRVNCSNCGHIEKKHINKIYAVVDNRIIIGALVFGIVLTLILINSFGFIACFTLTLPIIVWVNESNLVNSFNKYMIRR